jgi:S1-C subfamily serine protease
MPMNRTPLYARSRRVVPPGGSHAPTGPGSGAAAVAGTAAARPGEAPPERQAIHQGGGHAGAERSAAVPTRRERLGAAVRRHSAPIWGLGGAVLAVLLMLWLQPTQRVITQEHIDAAVRESLEKEPLPSPYAKAAAAIRPSVVRVTGLMDEKDDGQDNAEQRALERSLGTGVVIVNNGTILTNLHVVWGAKKVRVRFANGFESEADIVNIQPENDLAVLRARALPDDLEAATMRSTSDLQPGDKVVAVGHPFGIGPSVSAGVVSGLKREFRDPEGKKLLTNLIQFDAAANPGNSGGPLVTMDGQVVGIVTAILNPNEGQRTFVGIGFAVPIENAAAAAGMPPF